MPRRCSAVNIPMPCPTRAIGRSEEHTSELQSQSNLVCRLLLEKKKKHSHRCPSSRSGTTHLLLRSILPFVPDRVHSGRIRTRQPLIPTHVINAPPHVGHYISQH